jgi:chromosome segregation ATPase
MTESTELPETSAATAEAEREGWVVRFIRVLLRLVLVSALGVVLGGAVYLGAPALYRAWMEPVESNQARLHELAAAIEGLRAEQADRLGAQSTRIAELEGALAAGQERDAELESELGRLETGVSEVAGMQRQLDRLSASLGELSDQIAAVEDGVDQLNQSDPSVDQRLADVVLELQWVRAMELISRARLESLRGNDGLAKENLTQASQSIENLIAQAGSDDREPLEAVMDRLELAQQELPDNPPIAADDMEIAWRLLTQITAPAAGSPEAGG